jgi:hypothetical protein
VYNVAANTELDAAGNRIETDGILWNSNQATLGSFYRAFFYCRRQVVLR